jgi:hypothetical protein
VVFTIKSKKYLSEMLTFLRKNEIEAQKINETELSVVVDNENKQPKFEMLIAYFISYQLFVKTINEALQALMFEESFKAKFIDEGVHYFKQSNYWKDLSLVLVSDYFQNSKSIYIEGFMLFNMRGFKQEVQQYVKNATTKNEFEVDDTQGVQNLYAEIRRQISEKNIDLKIYEKVHVHWNDNTVFFQTDYGLVLDDTHLDNLLDVKTMISMQPEMKPWQKDIMLFPMLVMLLPVKKLLIHNNVIDDVKDALKRIASDFPSDRAVTIECCNGCDRCDQ